MIQIVPIAAIPPPRVEALLDRAFGPDRRGRTAYLIRGNAKPIAALSFAAVEADVLLGTIQCWPIVLATDHGDRIPLVMIGPVAVTPERQRGGLGRHLMARALAAAAETGRDGTLMLIGDPEYYARFFGFSAARTAAWRAPGPVERHRLLARGAQVPDAPGMLAEDGDMTA